MSTRPSRVPSFVTPVNGRSRHNATTPADEMLAFAAMKREYLKNLRGIDRPTAARVANQLRELCETIGFQIQYLPYYSQVYINLAIATVATLGSALDDIAKGEA